MSLYYCEEANNPSTREGIGAFTNEFIRLGVSPKPARKNKCCIFFCAVAIILLSNSGIKVNRQNEC